MPHTRPSSHSPQQLIHVLFARRARTLGALAVVVALSWASRADITFAQSTGGPVVNTDSGVYVAGDTVTITGRDFSAGETVTVEVRHANGTAEPAQPPFPTVQPDGTFEATWMVSGSDLSGPQLAVAVTGTVSGDIPPTTFLRVADVATDKGDYQPGETAIISGRGFAPNEVVRLQVTHANGQSEGLGHEPFYENADADGNVTAMWFVDPDDSLGSRFLVTAIGDASGVTGSATFWDAGPISLTTLDAPVSQNFNSLATTGTANAWTDNTTLDGWYSQFSASGQAANPVTYRADSGGSNTGAIYSWGVAGVNALTERAFGSVASGTPGNIFNAVRFVNNTGATIGSLDVSFIGEQWRQGGCNANPCPAGSPAAQKLDFEYQVANANVITDANTPTTGWSDHDPLDFTSPNPGPLGDRTARTLDGNAAANRTALSSTITVTVNTGQEIWLRWRDTNDAENDHGLAIDDFSVTPHGAVVTPNLTINDVSVNEGNAGTTTFSFTVNLSTPAGAGGVTFDIATADGTAQDGNPGSEDSDYVARSLTAQTIASGSSTYTFEVQVNGDLTVEPNQSFFVNVSNVAGATVTDAQGQGTIVNDDFALSFIHDAQGSGASSPLAGSTVMVEGVVVANFQGTNKLQGFFLEEEDVDADANPATSEGIFVFCNGCSTPVAEGQRVKVTGAVSEFNSMTEITASTPGSVVVTDAGNHLGEVTASPIDLPIVGDVNTFYESREGMKVTFVDTLTVSEYFELARYGQIVLYEGGRPRQFTEANAPSVAGNAAQADNLSRREVILDDDNNAQESFLALPNGSQYVYHPRANGGFSIGTQGTDFFRGGDLVSGLTGVLHWSFPGLGADTWRIRPTSANPTTFTVANPRPATPPVVGGAIKVVGMNLLNYFTTIDTTASSSSGPCGPSGTQDCRGADSVAELNRQRERASVVICTLNADIFAFAELENTTPSASITDLLGAVNARCGGAHPYDFVNTGGTLGTDAIRVQQIYRTGIVSPFGSPLSDMDPVHNRPPTAQTFDVVDATNPAVGRRFTVIANHFKSKGCPGSGSDADFGDGQGCFNATRLAQATRLLTWINTTVLPAAGGDPDVLLLGDFNSYAKEDPVTTLQAGGYDDLETTFHGANAYSYLFDGQLGHLDYAFANGSLQSQITGADAWHINADEVSLFDYNDEVADPGEASFEEKPDGSALAPPRVVYQAGTPYRASDHDPVIVGLFFSPPVLTVPGPQSVDFNDALTFGVSATDADAGDTLSFSATGLPAGLTLTDNGDRTATVSGIATASPGLFTATITVDDGHNQPVSKTVDILVTREETTTTYTGPLVIANGLPVTLSGRLLEDGVTPISGRMLTLSVGANSCTAGPTDVSGNASCTIPTVSVPLGPATVKADFAGDTFYEPSSDSQAAVVFAFPSRGAFVLGNTTVAAATPATSVTFWGAQWASLNSLSGGAAPSAFKGFAANLSSTPPVCGGTWTAPPGNSGNPVSAPLPSYMGVIVASSVSKSGSTVSGNVVRIVVVTPGAGYDANPGHAGTGTIIATYCQ